MEGSKSWHLCGLSYIIFVSLLLIKALLLGQI